MKRKLLYGKFDTTFPKERQIKLEKIQIQVDGTTNISLSGVKIFEIEDETQPITWGHLFHSRIDEFCNQKEIDEKKEDDFPFYLGIVNNYINLLWDDLKRCCNEKSSVEKHFFELYCQLCCDYLEQEVADLPALIPSVHINWEPNLGNKEKPYIVDFVFKSPRLGTNNLVIVEIDGFSHYAEYVEHLKKDRWLRKQGFQVFRIGNSEIEKIMELSGRERINNFYLFLQEVFGNFI